MNEDSIDEILEIAEQVKRIHFLLAELARAQTAHIEAIAEKMAKALEETRHEVKGSCRREHWMGEGHGYRCVDGNKLCWERADEALAAWRGCSCGKHDKDSGSFCPP